MSKDTSHDLSEDVAAMATCLAALSALPPIPNRLAALRWLVARVESDIAKEVEAERKVRPVP